ncbi:hypothetical protein BDZ89DRAFT_1100599 [Hymenopellis radicata]|nr:hypothetical protein BDZ89DRAFT_1100599 [Hymenopellis radicata]
MPRDEPYRNSWIDYSDADEQNGNIDIDAHLRGFQAPLRSLLPTMNNGTYGRARAPTLPSSLAGAPIDNQWTPPFSTDIRPGLSANHSESVITLNSPSSPNFLPGQSFHSPLIRSASEGESSFQSNVGRSRSLSRSSKSMLGTDPSQFPDPYPFRPPHHHLVSSPPGLSSADSSSASTRSSAYASSGSAMVSGEFSHVHVVSGDDDASVGVGITSDAVVQLLASDALSSSSVQGMQSRAPIDRTRWSEGSIRSRSSSIGNTTSSHGHEHYVPRLHEKPSFDMGWHTVDERDEVGISEEDTDDDPSLDGDDYDDEDEDDRTSAAVIAEEGRGLIVQGDSVPLSQLSVELGTTHLLVGSSNNPNAMPGFLTNNVPPISSTLLALDISANFLGALPPVLALCHNLEELNIASNPLRVLPVFLADLVNLRVIIADSTGISTLPDTLVDLEKLHTISVRRNKMHALPSWLCLLPALQTLCPLLAKTPMTPLYPPSTPMFPLPSASLTSQSGTETDGGTDDDGSVPPSAVSHKFLSPEDEDYTITPAKTLPVQPIPPPSPAMSSEPPASRPLMRTRTTPNRSYTRAKSTGTVPQEQNVESPLRKMKSAGDLRRGKTNGSSDPARPPFNQFAASSSNLLSLKDQPPTPERPSTKRYGSLGASTALGGSPSSVKSRPALTASLWDNISENGEELDDETHNNRISFVPELTSSPRITNEDFGYPKSTVRRYGKDGKEKGSRWGFLKKMSMGKMKPDAPPSRPSTGPALNGPQPRTGPISAAQRLSRSPQIDVRFSTTGILDAFTPPPTSPPQLTADQKPEMKSLTISTPASSSNLLAPPSPMPRSGKRRSFLPFDTPISLSIPDASTFVPGVTATNDDDSDPRTRSPSPAIDSEKLIRREEERAREAYMRALRSVMAYLKDMNDLGASQQPASRRPTLVDGGREVSMALSGTTIVSSDSSQLRSRESIAGLRSGGSLQTMSVATTDSNGSSEERVYKDDKTKRSMVVREIVVTERTYVKGLQELMDIYIKPGCAPVNMLTGVSSSKETVVPAAERKVVFNGVDALFSFHKESFLPALEMAAAPLMKPAGQQILIVAKAVGNIFVKHAAFMKMYSSYINNFDSSVQRVKYWTSDRQLPGNSSPGSTLSPSSSTAQLVGFGLTMSAVSAPGVADSSAGPAGLANLSSSQRKRIRAYLKRCRLSPRHSQLNLEGYLLLPVQRIPRYRLLLEELLRSTPPSYELVEDPLDRALAEISLLANNMNEGKRESESRRKLVQWQSRIRGKFPSPLVQPHRRLIMDGMLLLTRVVRKAVVSFEAINAQGDASSVQVDCLAPELTPRPLVGILCNDLLVLCRDPSEGQDPHSAVDLWAVLRMQTLPQPASIVHGNALRLVDNKAILYFDAPSSSDALNWFRAINLHIPASKT